MHIWTDLVAREAVFAAILTLIGSAPASLLSFRFDLVTRIAMAPALGFCLGSCVTTTLLQFWPAGKTSWVLAVLAVLSAGVAAARGVRGRRQMKRSAPNKSAAHSRRRPAVAQATAQLAVVCVLVAGPLTFSLHERHTVGPAAYTFTDVEGYVAEIDGAVRVSTGDAASRWSRAADHRVRFDDLTTYNWSFRAMFNQNLDAVPMEADATSLLGLGATDTFGPFLIVLLMTGGLGMFAGVRYVTGSRGWAPVVAGSLFGGAFFLELYYDTYQAAITGLGLIVPLMVLVAEVMKARRRRDVVLCGLVLSGFLTVYPLFVPLLVLAMIAALAGLGLRRRRRHEPVRSYLTASVLALLAVCVVAASVEPVASVRDVSYARAIIQNTLPLPRVSYHLPLDVLPGWLLQTREFWNMPPLGTGGFKQILIGLVIPLGFLALMVAGLRRHRVTLVLVLLAGVCGLVAYYSFASRQSCTYCAERNLLPLAPVGISLIGVGLVALSVRGGRLRVAASVLAAALVVLAAGQRARVELRRFVNSSYFLDSANRAVLAKLPRQPGALQLEGYDASLQGQAEEGIVYFLADEHRPGNVSLSTTYDDHQGLAYLTFANASVPATTFIPEYRYVLTRLGAVRTARRTIASSDGIALQERTGRIDITPVRGLGIPLARLDGSGTAWVQPQTPLVFLLTGLPLGRSAHAQLRFHTSQPVTLARRPGVRYRRHGSDLTVCVPAAGDGTLRTASLQLSSAPVPGPTPPGLFPPPVPDEEIALTAMRAVIGTCTL